MRLLVRIVLLLVFSVGKTLAQETPSSNAGLEATRTAMLYDQIIANFNNNIKDFTTWEAFKAAVLLKIAPHTPGQCYTQTAEGIQSIPVTAGSLFKAVDSRWQKTTGGGWEYRRDDGTSVEYRVNEQAAVLLRMESAKGWWFFVPSPTICAFPW